MMANQDVHQVSPPGVFASGQLPVGSREKDAIRFLLFSIQFYNWVACVWMKNRNNDNDDNDDDKYNDDNGPDLWANHMKNLSALTNLYIYLYQ